MKEIEIVYGQRPPNFEAIAHRFPSAWRESVVFAYGEQIFVPSGKPMAPQFVIHEKIHCARQQEMGVEAWWQQYLDDDQFMYDEELLAHAGEYRYICMNAARKARRAYLQIIAKRLSSPLYGRPVSKAKAERDILALVE